MPFWTPKIPPPNLQSQRVSGRGLSADADKVWKQLQKCQRVRGARSTKLANFASSQASSVPFYPSWSQQYSTQACSDNKNENRPNFAWENSCYPSNHRPSYDTQKRPNYHPQYPSQSIVNCSSSFYKPTSSYNNERNQDSGHMFQTQTQHSGVNQHQALNDQVVETQIGNVSSNSTLGSDDHGNFIPGKDRCNRHFRNVEQFTSIESAVEERNISSQSLFSQGQSLIPHKIMQDQHKHEHSENYSVNSSPPMDLSDIIAMDESSPWTQICNEQKFVMQGHLSKHQVSGHENRPKEQSTICLVENRAYATKTSENIQGADQESHFQVSASPLDKTGLKKENLPAITLLSHPPAVLQIPVIAAAGPCARKDSVLAGLCQSEKISLKHKLPSESSSAHLMRETDISDQSAKASKRKFSAPYKTPVNCNKGSEKERTLEAHLNSSNASHSRLKWTDKINSEDLSVVESCIKKAEEVAMTLLYRDGSTQLREAVQDKITKKKNNNDTEVTGIVIAFPKCETRDGSQLCLDFVVVSLDSDLGKWSRNLLRNLMAAKTRKLCFDAQEMMQTVASKCDFSSKEVGSYRSAMDPRIAAWLANPESPPATFSQLLKKCNDLKQIETSSQDKAISSDLSLLGPVMSQLYHKLKEYDLWSLYINIEMPLCPVLAAMAIRSIKINTEEMKDMKRLEKCAYEAAGHSFLISSHPQLRQVLYEELRLDTRLSNQKVARTGGNQKSTSEAVLLQLQDLHPLPKLVLEYRQIQKVKSTYVDGVLAFVKRGSLKTHWDQTAAVTGRLTSTNPNIQAVPKQSLVIKDIRKSDIKGKIDKEMVTEIFPRSPFISRDGWTLLAADFQQIEFRVLAHLTGNEALISVFTDPKSEDIFVELTKLWLGKTASEVTGADREQTKRVVYSVMYGAGKERLAEYLKISTEDAKAVIQSFLVRFPSINIFTRKCIEQARKQGYQTTICKRRRWLPHINHLSPHLKAQAERQAVNFCMQGSAADLCKAAMIKVEHALGSNTSLQSRLLFQIHDELLFEVPDGEVEEMAAMVKNIMEDTNGLSGKFMKLKVPLKVSLLIGKSWGHMKEYLLQDKTT